MALFLLIASIVIIISVLLNKVTSKLGIPLLLAFIVMGILFGSDGLFRIPFENYEYAEKICSIALIFIMFYGGFGTKWSKAKPVAGKAILLSSVGVVLTALFVGLFCYFILKIQLLESFLIGSVISSTDAASVFYILRSKRLNLKDNTASLLELESGSNDPCSYMLTIIVLSLMGGNTSGWRFVYMIFAQIIFGLLFGVLIAVIALFILKRVKIESNGFDAAFVIGIAILSYALPTLVGGNGYLSTYIVGIILGNQHFSNKKSLIHFFDGVTGLVQMLIFFLLGLLSFPSQMLPILLPSLAIAVFLTFIARPLAVFLLMTPFKASLNQQLIVSWAGLRGAASIVFAIMATIHPAHLDHDVFHIVFGIVLFSILLQGSLIPYLSKKLNMIDDNENVLTTFNDYSDEIPIQFVKLTVNEKHPWVGKAISQIHLPPDTLLVYILRGAKRIVPKGKTVILKEDILVLTAVAIEDELIIQLLERKVKKDSEIIGEPISTVCREDRLVILIKRGERIIIPNGNTIVKENDILVISEE